MTDFALHPRFLPPRLTDVLVDTSVVLTHGKALPILMLWGMS